MFAPLMLEMWSQSIPRRSALCKSALASVAPLHSGHSAQINRGVRRG